MSDSLHRARQLTRILAAAGLSLVVAACTPAAPAATPAPAKPTTPPAASSPATVPSPPAASPAAKPAPSPSVAASPSPVGSPVAAPKPAAPAAEAFNEQAVADFYRGKTVRIVIGYGAGGVIDTYSRTIAKYLGKHVPGNPTVIVENRGGAGSLTAANTVYNTEPKDGTVVGAFGLGLVLQKVLGTPGAEFEPEQYQWVGSPYSDRSTCVVRSTVAQSLQELIGGKEIATGTLGQGSETHQFPLALNRLLGTNFKLVPGYPTIAQARLAFDSGEIDAFCPVFSAAAALDRERLEGPNAPGKMIVAGGENPPDHPLLRGVPSVYTFFTTDEQRQIMRNMSLSLAFLPPYAMAPGVPRDRVLAMRQGLARTFADPEFVADAERAGLLLQPRTGQEMDTEIRDLVQLPQPMRDLLRPILT